MKNKKILLIICGGISAYKSLEVIRGLKKRDVSIKTILTKSGKNFVTPLSISSLSQEKVYEDIFSPENEAEMDHISLSRWADLILIVPATANTISKLSYGLTDDLASTVVLASDKQVFLVPAMNVRMWEHKSTKDNLSNIFRTIIIFHFGLITLWIIGAAVKSIRLISLWSLFIFLAVLAILRISSITLNGLPDFMIIIYLTFEIFGSAISLWLIKGMKKNKSNL